MIAKGRQEMTARKGVPGNNYQDRNTRTGLQRQDCQGRILRIRLPGHPRQDRQGRKAIERTARTGRTGQGNQDRTDGEGQPKCDN
jgi:hypothetical protein